MQSILTITKIQVKQQAINFVCWFSDSMYLCVQTSINHSSMKSFLTFPNYETFVKYLGSFQILAFLILNTFLAQKFVEQQFTWPLLVVKHTKNLLLNRKPRQRIQSCSKPCRNKKRDSILTTTPRTTDRQAECYCIFIVCK